MFELRQKKLDGMIVRSRTKGLFEDEKNTKYFCNLEKRKYVQKAMCVCFIEKKKKKKKKEEKKKKKKTPTLTDEDSNSLEGFITKQQAHSALKQMENDKSPG